MVATSCAHVCEVNFADFAQRTLPLRGPLRGTVSPKSLLEAWGPFLVPLPLPSIQWSKDLKVEPHTMPPESLPWALQHSIFILNDYLAHSSGKTPHFENYRYNYRSNIIGFGEVVLGDMRNIPTQKLHLRNQHQKLRSIWPGRDLITNEHILALPLQYSEHHRRMHVQADYSCSS